VSEFLVVFPFQQGWGLGRMPAVEKIGTFLADGHGEEYVLPSWWWRTFGRKELE
jgi:hypothetical protein